ncbi:MAG: alpha/beta hydrolase [Anaerolineales bacterium]|jgi:pimeloyl-ACP methyl ester carboxylesterase
MKKNMPYKYSIYSTAAGETISMTAYDAALKNWPVAYEEVNVNTRFGLTHIVVSGPDSGRPVILLHGQEASATMWQYNVQNLSQGFKIYAVDTIGDIGKSQPIRLPDNRDEYAVWLLDVLDQLKLSGVDLVGISYGGFLAINFAIANPNRVERIALLAPGIPNFGPPTFLWARYGLPMLMAPSRFTIKRFINGASEKGFSTQDLVHIQMQAAVPQMRNRNFMRPAFLDEELGSIKNACLLMIGDHEIMYEPGKAMERGCQLIPNLETKLISHAGHFLNSDQPEIVDEQIVRFLSGA